MGNRLVKKYFGGLDGTLVSPALRIENGNRGGDARGSRTAC